MVPDAPADLANQQMHEVLQPAPLMERVCVRSRAEQKAGLAKVSTKYTPP